MSNAILTSGTAQTGFGNGTTQAWLAIRLAACVLLLSRPLPAAEPIFVKAAKVYTMTGAPWQPGAVLIADGKIQQVGPVSEAPPGSKVIDLGSGILMPGLVDAHSTMDVIEGTSEPTREVTPGFQVLSGINWQARAFRESLDDGITSVNVAPGSENVLAGLASVVKTAGTRGHRIVSAESGLVVTVSGDQQP